MIVGNFRWGWNSLVPHPLNKSLHVGMLFSGIGVVEATCTLVASVLYNSIYPVTREVYPGLCFFIMAVGLALPFLLTM